MYIAVCAVCSVVIAAVMVPFSIFVIAPHFVQHILDTTSISLSNMTQLACGQNPYVQLFNTVQINPPAVPFTFGLIKPSAHLASYTQETYTTGCTTVGWDGNPSFKGGYDCADNETTELKIGEYSMQALTLNTGKVNDVIFEATLSTNFTVALNAWTMAFVLNPAHKARLILKAKDVQVTSMGFTFKGLTMQNDLTCTAMCTGDCPNEPIPNKVCWPDDPSHDEDQSPAYHMVCESGKHDIKHTLPPTMTPTALPASLASAIGMIV